MNDEERFSITINLSDYEVAHLLTAMKLLPNKGEWYQGIVLKIVTAVDELHLKNRF